MSSASSSTPPRPNPAAQGTLEKTPAIHLVVYALERKLNGTLELTTPENEIVTLLFIDGAPSKIATTAPVAYLGRVLVELGALSTDAHDHSLRELAEARTLHGQLLVDSGAVSHEQIRDGLREQLARKLGYLFSLSPSTQYAYYDGFDALFQFGGDETTPIDPMPLVWRAVCEHTPRTHMRASLSKVGNHLVRVARDARIERFGLEGPALSFVELLRSRPMRLPEMHAMRVLKESAIDQLLYCLLITKQVQLIQERADSPFSGTRAPAPSSEPPNSQFPVQRPTYAPLPSASIPPPPPSSPNSLLPPVASGSRTGDRVSFAFRPDVASTRGSMIPPSSPNSRPPGRMNIAPPPPPASTPAPPQTQRSPRSGAPPASVKPDAGEREREILERAENIDREDYFTMLGVSQDAPAEQVRAAYFGLAKSWHPDRLPAELANVRDACARVFSRMSEAHNALSDSERREEYMRLLREGGATPESQAVISRVIEAATTFQKAEICMKRNDLAQAEQLCRHANELDPMQADYLALLAWLDAQKADNQTAKASLECITALDRALSLNDRCERAYFYRGMLHKRLGNMQSAVRDFREAAELNPRNIDAVREVRLYGMRRSSQPPPKSTNGLFNRFFKK